jgi:hypothetical protein
MLPNMSTGFKEYVELKGTCACDEPIRGELSDTEAAIVETKVERVVERREERRDAQGNVRTEWRKSNETVSSNRRESTFYIEDETGRLKVKPKPKAIELVKVVDRFEAANTIEQMHGNNLTLSLGGFRLSIAGERGGSQSRTLGYKFVERILPVGKRLYAIGELADTEDEGLVLRAPTDDDAKKPFLISFKTEEELVQGSKKSSSILKYVGIGVAALGVVLAVVGILK